MRSFQRRPVDLFSQPLAVQLLHQLLSSVISQVLFKLEVPAVEFPHVLAVLQLQKVPQQVLQLVVVLAFVVRDYGNAVLQLKEVGIGCIIDQHHIAEVPVGDDSQILNVGSRLCLPAVLSVETVTHILTAGIKVVHYDVGVAWVTRCKHDHLELLRKRLQQLRCERPDVDTSVDSFAGRKLNFKFHVVRNL